MVILVVKKKGGGGGKKIHSTCIRVLQSFFHSQRFFFFLVRSPRTAPSVIGPLGTAAKDEKDHYDSFDPSAVCIIVLRHIVSLLSTPHSSSGASFPFDSFLILCVIEGGRGKYL